MNKFACLAVAMLLVAGTLSAEETQPDVFLLMTDQHRWDELGVAGTYKSKTPAMDDLAKRGVWFTHAFVTTPQCSPTRSSILTGLMPHLTGVMGNVYGGRPRAGCSPPMNRDLPTIGDLFKESGYETAYFGKWHLGHSPGDFGFATHKQSKNPTVDVIKHLERLDGKADRKPQLVVASWVDPHDIYFVDSRKHKTPLDKEQPLPASLRDDLKSKPYPQHLFLTADQGKPFVGYTDDQWRRYKQFYRELTTAIDADIGRAVKMINTVSDNAIIVFTSEHGDLGGAHGLPYKGPMMYDELMRVPLSVTWEGKINPGKSDALVSSIDLLPTLCDLTGVKPPKQVDGANLRPLWEAKDGEQPKWRDAVIGQYYGKQNWRVPIRMIRTHRWKYVRYLDFGEELYDLETDPSEITNLVKSEEHQTKVDEMKSRMNEWIKESEDPFYQLTDNTKQEKPK